MIKREQKLYILAILVAAAFFVSIIPIAYAGLSAHPVYDDYWFSGNVHRVIMSGGGILAAFKTALSTVKNIYFTWQGTFSAVFIFAIQPGVVSQNAYGLTTIIMIMALSLSTYFFIETLICRLLNGSKVFAVLISCLTLIMSIQFVPDIRQAFFWFNGSSYYTLFYSFSLTLLALGIRIVFADSIKKRSWIAIVSCILAFIIGGGNYTTALLTSEIYILFVIYLIYTKNRNWKMIMPIIICLLVAFCISIVAPGNDVRAAGSISMSPIKAIIMSIFYSCVKIGEWTRLPQIVFCV